MPDPARRPGALGARGMVLIGIVLAGLAAAVGLGLAPGDLVPNAGGARIAGEFLAAALRPALDYEADYVPSGTAPFLYKVLAAVARTVVFAAAAMSLALLVGLPLGFVASEAWWERGDGELPRRRSLARVARGVVRIGIALMRSVHELLWAVVFLAAMGLNTMTAVVAIAIPFAGTLAKVFSEMLDEAPRNSARALSGLGAPPLTVFLFGLFPRALPDLAAYAFYRFECAVRSSAILGFFGYQTLGYHLGLSFQELHYREVWTYLYALIVLVLVLEGWSAALRRRLVA